MEFRWRETPHSLSGSGSDVFLNLISPPYGAIIKRALEWKMQVSSSGDQRSRRREYGTATLKRVDLAADPLRQFAAWLDDAVAHGAVDATAMALATAGAGGMPSVRIVLLKHFDANGLCWYTDYRSLKGTELAENPFASALFYWREQDRQVRITGSVERLSVAESAAYFESRPSDSRYAAAASVQSAPVANREALEQTVQALRQAHAPDALPRPPDWGGYRLHPVEYEFWQGRLGRLHDRFSYRMRGSGLWDIVRLQP